MNAQQVVVGIYLALEKGGAKNLVQRTRAAARAAGCSFSNAESSRWIAPFVSVNGRKTDGIRTENGRFSGRKFKHETDGSSDEKRTENGQKTDSRANKVSLVTKPRYIPESSTNSLAPLPPGGGKRARVIPAAVEFEHQDDERRAGAIVSLVAAENKTGSISAARILTLRGEIYAAQVEHGAELWRYGLDQAIARGKGWQYARAVMRSGKIPAVATRGSPAIAPNGERRRGYSWNQPTPEKRALIAKLGKDPNAIRSEPELLARIDQTGGAENPYAKRLFGEVDADVGEAPA